LDDVKAELNAGMTPLHYAAMFKGAEVVQFMLDADAGADVNAVNNGNWTPLHYNLISAYH